MEEKDLERLRSVIEETMRSKKPWFAEIIKTTLTFSFQVTVTVGICWMLFNNLSNTEASEKYILNGIPVTKEQFMEWQSSAGGSYP